MFNESNGSQHLSVPFAPVSFHVIQSKHVHVTRHTSNHFLNRRITMPASWDHSQISLSAKSGIFEITQQRRQIFRQLCFSIECSGFGAVDNRVSKHHGRYIRRLP